MYEYYCVSLIFEYVSNTIDRDFAERLLQHECDMNQFVFLFVHTSDTIMEGSM